MINIGIIGIGGVGGYLASKLLSYYQDSEVHISLFARGESAKVLRRDGLTLKQATGTTIVKPYAVYEPMDDAPKMDYLFVCVKSYSVKEIVEQIERITNESSVIIPFQNGVDGRVQLVGALPNRKILDGCVYIMSRIESTGVIIENGIPGRIQYYYGSPDGKNEGLEELESILSAAFDHISLVDDISQRVWAKFSRISTLSILLTYHDISCGEMVASEEYMREFVAVVEEFAAVAQGEGYKLRDDIVKASVDYALITPFAMTTSMQRDYRAGKRTEIEGQCGYIVRCAEARGIKVPLYKKMYNDLITRITK